MASLVSVAKRNFNERYNIHVVLLLALKLQQVVVGAANRIGIFAANCRARVIDRAAARFRIQKLTSLAEQRISFASEHALFRIHLGEARRCLFLSNTKMLSQPADIAGCDLDSFVD